MSRTTGVIRDSQIFKQGEQVLLAVDLWEVDDQSFLVSSGSVTVEDDSGVEIVALTALAITVTTGVGGRARVQRLLLAAETAALAAGHYVAVWSLTLSDTQTREMRESLQVVVA